MGLKLPVIGNVPLADGYVLYADPSYVAVGGGFNAGFLNNNLVIDGGLQGQVNFGNGQFNIEGQAGLFFKPFNFSLQASTVVSNIGIAGCGQITLFNQTAAAGIGYTWGEGISGIAPILGSCNLRPWRRWCRRPEPGRRR